VWVGHLIKTWLKWLSASLAAGALVTAGILLWLAEPAHQEVPDEPPARSLTQIDRPMLVEKKGDRLVWRLQAESAKQKPDGNLEMRAPELDLFTGSDVEVPVRSRKAFVDTSKRKIRFQGDVVVLYNEWELRGQVLIYDISRDLILMPANFHLTGPGIIARGKNMTIDRHRERLLVEDKVWIQDNSAELWPTR